MKDLRETVFEMDRAIGVVGGRVETLSDIVTVLSQLRDSMDTAAHQGKEQIYYREHHRKVRLLSELMRYLVDDLVEAYDEAYTSHQAMFDKVVREVSHEDSEK